MQKFDFEFWTERDSLCVVKTIKASAEMKLGGSACSHMRKFTQVVSDHLFLLPPHIILQISSCKNSLPSSPKILSLAAQLVFQIFLRISNETQFKKRRL